MMFPCMTLMVAKKEEKGGQQLVWKAEAVDKLKGRLKEKEIKRMTKGEGNK